MRTEAVMSNLCQTHRALLPEAPRVSVKLGGLQSYIYQGFLRVWNRALASLTVEREPAALRPVARGAIGLAGPW